LNLSCAYYSRSIAHHHRSTFNHRCSSPSIDTMPTMSPPSSPQTPLDCFAQVIKLITLAAVVIDQRITELVPVFAESFITVSRLPKKGKISFVHESSSLTRKCRFPSRNQITYHPSTQDYPCSICVYSRLSS
jgi:hypothetical protein